MGMWIGGDRDGNPYVTAEPLGLTASIQSQVILDYYLSSSQLLSLIFERFIAVTPELVVRAGRI